MSIIDTITTDNFMQQFPRFTPVYMPLYESKTYFQGDIVYYGGSFYQCIVASTSTSPSSTTNWQIYNTSVLNYTQDSDIVNAMNEAKINFNEDLFEDTQAASIAFLYLTAFYLTLDFQNALNPSSGGGIVSSKSVGSVSESYSIPQWMLNNPTLSIYAQNGYGRKYLSLIQPYLIGNIILAKGATTSD